MTVRRGAVIRLFLALALIVVTASNCSVARRANDARPSPGQPAVIVPAAVAPPQPEGLDGSAGAPGPQVCTAISAGLGKELGVKVTAKRYSWNDGGLPALDLCTLLLDDRPVQIGVSALPKQPDSLSRLSSGLTRGVPELGPDARLGTARLAFTADDRVVRITSPGGIDRSTATGIDRAKAVAIGLAVRAAVPAVLRNARQVDAACQVSTSAAERFVGAQVQLRRDYRVNGALTCIWGTFDATVSIVESFDQDTIPEIVTSPPPAFAPIGEPGYYLPDQGELVFREGRRVVRVTGLTVPSRPVSLDTLVGIVGPLLPLFIR
ncbi:hypothetical protein [Kribbella monticola]|uniref:hypothetical protein n=1 Tax=Kribbella monticola TaxID=2185285 RepID=UPI001E56ECA7|nr:hypothetical protein [Kribbella monticola]